MVEYPGAIVVKLPQLPGASVGLMVGVRELVTVLVRVSVRVGVLVRVGVDVIVLVCVGVGGTQPEPTSVGTFRLTISHMPSSPKRFQPQQ